MKLANVNIEDAVGSVLIHNVADAQGHKALSKGHRVESGDVEKLRALNKKSVFVGIFGDGDVTENEAATRVANAIAGENITQSSVSGGRINFLPVTRGILKVNDDALNALNLLDGITIATVPSNTVVLPKKLVATIKTIGLAIPEETLQEVERIGRQAPNVVSVHEMPAARVAVILTGSAEARERIERTIMPAISSRLVELGASMVSQAYVEHSEAAIAGAVRQAQGMSVECVILAGETSIMDAGDVTPAGILQAGGVIEVYGAPVEPGNLFLLGYVGNVPIIGAPGCIKSRDTNVVDLVLPRLLAGERIGKKDIVALANGGLLI